MPFARSRIKALRAAGLKYASQQFEIDGCSVKVRIEPGHEYIVLSGGDGLHMLINLVSPQIGNSVGYVQKTATNISLIYRLDLRDPMNAKKAKLVYAGGTDTWSDNAGYTLDPTFPAPGAVEQNHTYMSIPEGYDKWAVDGAFAIGGKLLTYSTVKESWYKTTYPGVGGYLSYNNWDGAAWETTETTVTYKGKSAKLSERKDTEGFSHDGNGSVTGEKRTTVTYSGIRAYTWPYYVRNATLEDGTTAPYVHIYAGPKGWSYTTDHKYAWGYYENSPEYFAAVRANNAAITEYRWSPEKDEEAGVDMHFSPDPVPEYVAQLIRQDEDYTYGQLGFRDKGFDYISSGNTIVTRNGTGIPTGGSPDYGFVYGDLLGRGFYVGFNPVGRTFQVKRLSDDVKFGSRMVLTDLPGILSKPESRLMAESTEAFTHYVWEDVLKQGSFASRTRYPGESATMQVDTYITFLNDAKHQMERGWKPMTGVEPEAPRPG